MTRKDELHVCSYNIHKGFNLGNRRFLLSEIREAIRSIDTDLVFLQEVRGADLHDDDERHENQFEFLADTIWPHYAYGHNAIYDMGHHGNAILSKHSFSEFNNYDVSRWSFSQRGILLGKTEEGIYLANIHFGLFQLERTFQQQALVTLINEHVPADAPLIIAGDFNDWNRKTHKQLTRSLNLRDAYAEKSGKPAKTFPVHFPLFTMDRIYYRGLDLLDAKVLKGSPWNRLSDHAAIYANFSLSR